LRKVSVSMRLLMPWMNLSSSEKRTGPSIAATRIGTLHLPPTWSSTWPRVQASAINSAPHASGSGSVASTVTPV
jgi:hypothetical protein